MIGIDKAELVDNSGMDIVLSFYTLTLREYDRGKVAVDIENHLSR